MPSADVVIIGGGIVGSSVAYHLTQAGCRNVVVLERESQQGKGSTGKSMGGVRAQFATPVNIRMSLYSIPPATARRATFSSPRMRGISSIFARTMNCKFRWV
jgi:glycine/D-amino acid oxidase-like deaminating enzyme